MQKHSSKNTSINTKRLPAVYNKVDWSRYANEVDDYYIVDIGCGRMETQSLIRAHLASYKVPHFIPYDPYHCNPVTIEAAKNIIADHSLNKVVVCSNVLNVLDTQDALWTVIKGLCDAIVVKLQNGTYRINPCYITVYEGNKTGIGKETKPDCWQRNERIRVYLNKLNRYVKDKYNHEADFFKIYHGMIVGICQ
jgi:hypothetical protein